MHGESFVLFSGVFSEIRHECFFVRNDVVFFGQRLHCQPVNWLAPRERMGRRIGDGFFNHLGDRQWKK